MAASSKLHLSGSSKKRLQVFLEILSLLLQARDVLPRVSKQFNPNDASVAPEGDEDRERQLVLVQHEVFQEAMARFTAGCSIEDSSGKKVVG